MECLGDIRGLAGRKADAEYDGEAGGPQVRPAPRSGPMIFTIEVETLSCGELEDVTAKVRPDVSYGSDSVEEVRDEKGLWSDRER
jgi:hypothetical protein